MVFATASVFLECGNEYGEGGGEAPESECARPCTGDSSIKCGGDNHSSICTVTSTVAVTTNSSQDTPTLKIASGSGVPFYSGCYMGDVYDGQPIRDLSTFFCSNGKQNPRDCADDHSLPSGASQYAGTRAMPSPVPRLLLLRAPGWGPVFLRK